MEDNKIKTKLKKKIKKNQSQGINAGKYSYLLNNEIKDTKKKIFNQNYQSAQIVSNKMFNDLIPSLNITQSTTSNVNISRKKYSKKQTSESLRFLYNNIDTIVNVYNLTYKKYLMDTNTHTYTDNHTNIDVYTTGLGDFIRGCYFLMKFCDDYNFCFSVIIDHPISSLLENFYNIPKMLPHLSNIVTRLDLDNFNSYISETKVIHTKPDFTINNDFIAYLKGQKHNNKEMLIHTIAFSNHIITEKYKEHMREILTPVTSLINYIDDTILNLTFEKKSYEIIHIRFGDKYLIQKEQFIFTEPMKIIVKYLKNLNINNKYLLISDNEIIKEMIVENYPFIRTLKNKILHTGENFQFNIEQLRDTMLEFYLMSHSTNIMSFSVYKHGTGFSQWCAETYNIQYECKYIGEEL